jgi:phosphoglycerol transferase MdoB-like AlkP superfamily enzyme
MEATILNSYHFISGAWLPILLLTFLLTMFWKLSRKENAGLTMFQRFIRLCFSFARCTHGFACAVDGAFVAYRVGKNEYAGTPVNERMYPAKPTTYDDILAHGQLGQEV